jgi:curved DNA-binding protein CbpA
VDFYHILGIPADADEVAIRRAYKILARRYHPDTGADSSIERFREVAEAYETLSEPGRRRDYDRLRSRDHLYQYPIHPCVEPITAGREFHYRHQSRDGLFAALLRTIEEDFFGFAGWRWWS